MAAPVKRVCLLGAESTGKTTLAEELADAYGTLVNPEYGRPYTEVGRDRARPLTVGPIFLIGPAGPSGSARPCGCTVPRPWSPPLCGWAPVAQGWARCFWRSPSC